MKANSAAMKNTLERLASQLPVEDFSSRFNGMDLFMSVDKPHFFDDDFIYLLVM
jgi:hypothetical protein